ncbi:MAG: hypothetical protein JXR96_22190 [Deltaproteobacteria bacterium]|nr:hypothetical protein [Deltaproteobacteria bacterium]
MRNAFTRAVLLAAGLAAGACAGPSIHGRLDDGVEVRMFGHASLEAGQGEFQVACQGQPGETLVLYFLRKGYYPQIRLLEIPTGRMQQTAGPWRELPDALRGVLAGVVCTCAAGGRRARVFFVEGFESSRSLTIELDGRPTPITTDARGVFVELLPPGRYRAKVDWAPRLFGDGAGTIEIEAAATTILDICKLTTLVD